ncbi:PadR family transcriptional regulator [Nocardioides zeae]|uniref:DNA-binding PadR family transcriptional regulator n=1 Tax=Nocardioides zeae TaxID=1457234 RepID=A0AAJ1U983_9ACTN|nr:PadR family transcriptional regulator [Nocardioides zeae]MDQ1106457.1 DNA-binding PadR family transcriptional regulator [Nocardioides zeae]
MSVRNALLALLDPDPKYGYQLRAEFEARTGATWPLNIGQVYTTLARLERDGLVERQDEGGGEQQVLYALTERGRAESAAWFASPVPRATPPRDELAIKLALAVDAPDVDVVTVIQRQREATVAALQEHTRAQRRARPPAGKELGVDELAWSLVLDSLVFAAEAEVRWLDHCETRLARRGRPPRRTGSPGPDPTPVPTTDPEPQENAR